MMNGKRNNHMISQETTQEIESITQFFKNPIIISDKRGNDTPTIHGLTKTRIVNPTQTVTFHSKAAMSDINKLFGAQGVHTNINANVLIEHNNNNGLVFIKTRKLFKNQLILTRGKSL
eukprot:167769_1